MMQKCEQLFFWGVSVSIVQGALAIQEEKRDNLLVLHLNGKLDALSSPSSEKKIFDFIHEGYSHLILDFSGVDYISSAGLRMLLSTNRKAKSVQGKIVLCCVQKDALEVLTMTGFDRILEMTTTLDEAIASS
jgi:anti-anti-sigma factor